MKCLKGSKYSLLDHICLVFNCTIETNDLIVCFGNITMWKTGGEKKKKAVLLVVRLVWFVLLVFPGQDHTMIIPVWDTLKYSQKLANKTCSGKS